MDSQAFLGELVCFASYWGRGNNHESILLISPVADLSDLISPLQDAGMQIYNSFSGCRNHSTLHGGMGYSLICLRSPDTLRKIKPMENLPIFELVSYPYISRSRYFSLSFFLFLPTLSCFTKTHSC
jgi:hypothetical protein